MQQRRDLFDLMMKRVAQISAEHGDKPPQGFTRWFGNMYFGRPIDLYVSDGSGDGKADAFVTIRKPKSTRYAILNAKFTRDYDRSSPVSFYDEITRFWQAFENKANRAEYLNNAVRESLRSKYKTFFNHYDDGLLDLYFITNHRVNPRQFETVKSYGVHVFHLEEILQYLIEHVEGALPETDPLILSDITSVLTPPPKETEVPTSIVFARLVDFIRYMEEDPFDLLFARNVRLWLGRTETNKEIGSTFENRPKEFAYSNNGITLLCKSHQFDPGKRELNLTNPRVVNGSQTLHSVRDIDHPSESARIMVRIIEIPTDNATDLPKQRARRREIIHKISVRSNMQNPIKRWNLVSNDDFQNELSQFFWQKGYFYERRQREWKQRKDDLMSIGIKKGPEIRRLMQFIASYHYDRSSLGPANAQGQLNELFDEEPYEIIRTSSPELVYRIFLLGELVLWSLEQLKHSRSYIADVAGYVKFTLFSITCRTISQIDSRAWTKETFEQFLESQYNDPSSIWTRYCKDTIDFVLEFYKKEARKANREGWYLTPANFFKSRLYITHILQTKLPQSLRRKMENLLES
jgi:hypothetical protein